jgi:WD40 repeat protein
MPLAHAWERSGRRVDYLITGHLIDETVAWLNTGVLVPPNVSAFISESLQYRVSERDRRADIAARKALETFSHDPETAIVLSLEACTALSPTVLARFALYRSLATGLRHVLHQPGPVSSVAFAADGHLAVGTGSGAVRIYSTDADLLRDLTDLPGPVNSVAFGADGRLAVGTGRSSDVGSVQIYTSGGQLINDLIDLPGPVRSVAFAPDGRLAVGTGSGAARIYDPDGQLLHHLSDQAGPVDSVAFAADRQSLEDLTDQRRPVNTVAFSADGRLAIASGPGFG